MISLLDEGPCRKLRRGGAFLSALGPLCRGFTDDLSRAALDITTQSREHDERGEWAVVRFGATKEVPPEWALIAGDAMHNVRSSLDHLIGALARLNGNDITDDHAFPVWDRTPKPDRLERMRREELGGLHPDDRLTVEELLPYKDPTSERSTHLLGLHAFDVVDKHRHVQPVVATTVQVSPVRVGTALTTYGPIVEGSEWYRVPVESDKGASAHWAEPTSFDIAFGGPPLTFRELCAITETVRTVLVGFEPTFRRPERNNGV